MTEINIKLGQIIRDRRKSLGFSQEELAFKSGLHRTYISQIERGLKSPTVDTLFKLCKSLGARTSELIADTEN